MVFAGNGEDWAFEWMEGLGSRWERSVGDGDFVGLFHFEELIPVGGIEL